MCDGKCEKCKLSDTKSMNGYKFITDRGLYRIKQGFPSAGDLASIQLEQIDIARETMKDLKKLKSLFVDVFKKEL